LLFVGTYTGGTTGSEGIYAFRFDDATGTLTPRGLAVTTPNPSFLVASADRRVVFAVNELDNYEGATSGSVTSFAVDATAAKLSAISTLSSRGAHPCHLELDKTGRFLGVANYTGGNYSLLPVNTDGRLEPAVVVVSGKGRGPTARQEGPHGHAVTFDAANRFLIATDLGIDRVMVYRFDPAAGALVANTPPSVGMKPGAGPRHFVFHPNGRQAFVINELDSTITSLAWDGTSGLLSVIGTVSTLPAGVTASTTAEIHVHPNGRFVYGSNRGHDSIAGFAIDSDTGKLTPAGHQSSGGKGPRNFAIDPSGNWMVIGNQSTDNVLVCAIDAGKGTLTPKGTAFASPVPICFKFVRVTS
jgi:6-phosphogluconolactonase